MCFRTSAFIECYSWEVPQILLSPFFKKSLWDSWTLFENGIKIYRSLPPKFTCSHDTQKAAHSLRAFMEPKSLSWIKKAFHLTDGKLRLREGKGMQQNHGSDHRMSRRVRPMGQPWHRHWQTEGVWGAGCNRIYYEAKRRPAYEWECHEHFR